MAQTIKHRRGSVASVRNITSFGEAEIVIGSGSVDGKVDGPIVYIGKPGGSTAANDYAPISKLYTGAGLPEVKPANYGTTLDGLPYYDSTNKKLYILNAHNDGTSGHTEIILTKNSLQNFATEVSASAVAAGFGGGGIFTPISAALERTTKNIQITGSLEVSSSIKALNTNVGTPTSNDWGSNLDGSYFNNFTKDTDVSEVLRFVAGLLSSSAANPTPNSKTLSNLSVSTLSSGTGTAPKGYVPQGNKPADVLYLIDRGFAAEGGTLFPGKSIMNNTGLSVRYSSTAGGSTSVQSSNDSQLFGLGTLSSGNASEFQVKATHGFRFNNNNSGTQTETSASTKTLTQDSFGTSNGVTLAKINTVNPAVIPAAFQDGKFVNVHGENLVNWTTETLTSVSASGTYILSTTIGIKTGSQSAFVDYTATTTYFWAPVSNIDANIDTNTLASSNEGVTGLTLTSGSLSGAPYISGGTWKLVATASGLFAPLYDASTTLVDVTIGSTSGYTISNSAGNDTLSTSGGSIQTSGMVTSADGNTARNSGVPHRTDLVEVDATYTISGTGDTFTESGFGDTSYTLTLKGRNRAGSQSTLDTQTVNLHTAGTFGQPASSGSMGYYGGGNQSTALDERFTNETYRRIISNSTSLTNAWNSVSTTIDLGDGGDLQVKPGYLVEPESANGYWYPTSGYDASHYKWYLREFDTSASNNKGTLTINLDPNSSSDLVAFSDTAANKVAVGVIFEATDSKIFDAVKGNQSYGGSLNSQSTGANNPFSDSVDVVGDFSSFTNSNGTLTLGLNNAGGQTINSSNSKIWLLIRYKGTPGQTLERMTVSVS
tara:strand:+ start:35 stop:2515 length:2481 start_codon:yes stop_codon:yes gene_type:complete